MRIIAVICLLCFVLSFNTLVFAQDCGDAMNTAYGIMNAIKKSDAQHLMSFVGGVIWFTDERVDRKALDKLLKDKKSWLYKALFTDKDSTRRFLENGDIEIKILVEGPSRFVSFLSKKEERLMPPSFNLMCNEGKWLLTDIYTF